MYAGYKVIAITPGGRRRYLRILREYVKCQPLIDEHHILLNPIDEYGEISREDDLYISNLRQDGCVVLETAAAPSNIEDSVERRRWGVSRLFRFCLDPNAVYIFLSDDIVWMAPDAIEKLLIFRLHYEQYFLAFANVVNTSMCSYFQQQAGYFGGTHSAAIRSYKCPVSTASNAFAEYVHSQFLAALDVSVRPWIVTDFSLNLDQRREIMPLQVFSFFGKECAYFDGIVPELVEHVWLCSTYCHQWEMWNGFCGSACFSHFAHREQEDYLLNNTDLLERYVKLAPNLEMPVHKYVEF